MNNDEFLLAGLVGIVFIAQYQSIREYMSDVDVFLIGLLFLSLLICGLTYYLKNYSVQGKERKAKTEIIKEIPESLKLKTTESILMGVDPYLHIPIYLPDHIRRRHVHILGATGSGKTESVILNFLKQDTVRGYGAIIMDAKGDHSFLSELHKWVDPEKLKVFDLSDESSISYNPLILGSPLESAQRLFASLTWSEEYYKSKALSALQAIFQYHYKRFSENPTLLEILNYLKHAEVLADILDLDIKTKNFEKEFSDLSGLRDQIRSLCVGHLGQLLSQKENTINLADAQKGSVIYFRLQSLLSPQAVKILGRLLINNLNFLAGRGHRDQASEVRLVPTYLDEFASFACEEFADLISKARSAGFALHFSHQSIGDVQEVSAGFLNRITDNSATKIVLRINDPDSAEFFARSFGTKLIQKITQRVSGSTKIENGDLLGEGTVRDAHQFRSSPDLFKTLPTGMGSVLIAHGYNSKEGASHVFKIQFPRLN